MNSVRSAAAEHISEYASHCSGVVAALTEDFDRVWGVIFARNNQGLLEGGLESHYQLN